LFGSGRGRVGVFVKAALVCLGKDHSFSSFVFFGRQPISGFRSLVGTIQNEMGGQRAGSGVYGPFFPLPDTTRRLPAFSIVSTHQEPETGHLDVKAFQVLKV